MTANWAGASAGIAVVGHVECHLARSGGLLTLAWASMTSETWSMTRLVEIFELPVSQCWYRNARAPKFAVESRSDQRIACGENDTIQDGNGECIRAGEALVDVPLGGLLGGRSPASSRGRSRSRSCSHPRTATCRSDAGAILLQMLTSTAVDSA
ncbi:hypothetical protein RHA1_ro07111 [Rhodococcus jostii RHA1]|uniref:Uncharacterized protein n=1 Tax=Rhodococcus jostii (strain RHA1) TaxID=101510 RepID=Q0S0R1_RHOJR|nr:hypothetical protein RHA1_ro07111 [Rhodococcus jostii RHA1]